VLRIAAHTQQLDRVRIHTGQRTQTWLAVSTESAAMVTGRYWQHLKPELPAAEAMDVAFQDKLVARLQAR
jgi:hypothetical protein